MATSLSVVGIFWSVLSFTAALVACLGYFMPYWLLGSIPHSDGGALQQTSFGTFRRCGYIAFVESTSGQTEVAIRGQFVAECGRYKTFNDIPSIWWQATTVVTGVGCCIGLTVGFAGLLCWCVGDAMSQSMAVFACVSQLVAGGCVAVGCLLYPVGWDNDEVLQACSSVAHRYSWGTCTIGWAYWTTIAGGATVFLCAWLACYAARRKGGYQRPSASARV